MRKCVVVTIHRCRSLALSLALLPVFLLGTRAVAAQAATQEPAPPATAATPAVDTPVEEEEQTGGPSVEELTRRRDSALVTSELDDETRKRLAELYDRAISSAQRAQELREEAAKLTARVTQAPAEIEQLQQESGKTVASPPVAAATLSAADLELGLRQEEAQLSVARAEVQEREQRVETERRRPQEMPLALADTRARLEAIRAELEGLAASEDEPADITEARRLALEARQRMRQAETALLEQQLSSHDLLLGLSTARRDQSQRNVAGLEASVKLWREAAQQRREAEAERSRTAAEKLEQQAADMPGPVQELARDNTSRTEQFEQLTDRESEVARQLEATEARLQEVQSDFTSARQRVEEAGFNETVALLLRRQRDALPESRTHEATSRARRKELAAVSSQQLEVESNRKALFDLDLATANVMASVAALPASASSPLGAVERTVRRLLSERLETLDRLDQALRRHQRQLVTLDNADRRLLSLADEYGEFLDQHLLWIRSTAPVDTATLGELGTQLRWLLAPSGWVQVGRDLAAALGAAPVRSALAVLALLGLLAGRRGTRRYLDRAAAHVGKVRTDQIRYTFLGLLFTAATAVAGPAMLGFLGRRLEASSAALFSRAVGSGLQWVALFLAVLWLLRALSRERGLGAGHFHWDEQARRETRRGTLWLALWAAPLVLVVRLVEYHDDEALRNSLGRTCFVLSTLLQTGVLGWTLRPGGGVARFVARRNPEGLLKRTWKLWYVPVVAAPFTLAVLSLLGYYYSALKLEGRLETTLWMVVILMVLQAALIRWLFVVQRRVAFQETLRRREERQKQAPVEESEAPLIEEPTVDLAAVNRQSGGMIRATVGLSLLVGLWAVWADVLPALGALDRLSLWSYGATVDGVATQVPVTLLDGLVCLVFLAITVLAARNLPGLLQLVLLSRLNLDTGSRYAVVTICRYGLTALGLVLAFQSLGVRWGHLQFLVAALGVGLGFGLQEIFANFVSGLILLFERPVRVGDIVTIGGVTGTVSRIQMRATTITDWDRKELVVPNKDFITGHLLNWTLSNEINRIVIPVGVAYGTDTEKARELLIDTARQHPLILDDPAPGVTFEGFGDNSLNLVLRCYLPDLNNRLATVHELHTTISQRFLAAGLEIAFPQRDIHLDSIRPLEVRLTRESLRPAATGGNGGAGAETGSPSAPVESS